MPSTPGMPAVSGESPIHDMALAQSRSMIRTASRRYDIGFKFWRQGLTRRTLGIILLLATVILWTGSNFLASDIFADDTFSKPYFVTYVNTSFFAISLLPISIRLAQKQGFSNIKEAALSQWRKTRGGDEYSGVHVEDGSDDVDQEDDATNANAGLLFDSTMSPAERFSPGHSKGCNALTIRETAWLSLEFCLLWFIANYFVAACLTYTSVASSTILTSTSSIWTLVFGALVGVESFSLKKLVGVLASLTGVMLISSIDLSGENDESRGSFPYKSRSEIAIGDAMAIFSAVMYGIYTVVMKKRIGNEERVSMPLFFGMVGFFNVVFLWPGFLVLHYSGVEDFELPPTFKIWVIVLLNSVFSFVSDYCWAYAMLLTTPLVVTVGISLTIPLSLIGQMILSSQYVSAFYWFGAFVVVLSFLFVNHESREDEAVT